MFKIEKRSFVILLIAALPVIIVAQSTRWKRNRYEVTAGIGASNFLGELGGSNKEGSEFLSDLEISLTRPAFNLGMRYWLDRRLILQTSLSFGYLWGDDSKTEEFYRNERNLHFRSVLWELQARLEYTLIEPKKGHRYNLRKVRGRPGNKITLDAFIGVCGFYFNPKQKIDGEWYELQPIGTEGQNFSETREPYSRVQVGIPLGFHLKYLVNSKWSIGLEVGPRYTFTDYIDDVSTTYADVDKIIEYNENEDASEEVIRQIVAPIQTDDDPTNDSHAATYQQRGNPYNNDMYMFMFVTISYKLRTGRNGLPLLR